MVCHGRGSYELNINIGEKVNFPDNFCVEDILAFENAPEHIPIVLEDPTKTGEAVSALADIVRHFQQALQCDGNYYRALKEHRDRRMREKYSY